MRIKYSASILTLLHPCDIIHIRNLTHVNHKEDRLSRNAVTSGEELPIQPKDIDGSKHFFSAFDHTETEVSANWIIRFLQERGQSWRPFSYEDIDAFYARKFKNGFRFNRLVEAEMVPPSLARAFAGYRDPLIAVGGGWIIHNEAEGLYYVTEEFIMRCHKASPTKKRVAV